MSPFPYTVTSMLSSVAMKGPERVLTVPAMPGSTCWVRATSGIGHELGQDASHSRTADASVDREVIFLQFPGDALGGAVLLVG
jgi:hypothetical protein